MKASKGLWALVLLGMLPALPGSSDITSVGPKLVNMLPENSFIPPGFDDNDNAQIVVAGSYPNSCFRAGPAKAQVDEENKKIYIANQAYYYPSCWCVQVLVPYVQTVNLGILKAGTYQVVVMDNDGSEHPAGEMPIAAAKGPEPDDFLYAAVDQAFLEPAGSGGQPVLTISGTLGNSCMYIEEVKVLSRAPGVVEILPLAKVRENEICQQITHPFITKVPLGNGATGSTLIHIRSLNGQSINKVADL